MRAGVSSTPARNASAYCQTLYSHDLKLVFRAPSGAEAIFPPGTVISDAAEELIHKLNARLGHSEAAE